MVLSHYILLCDLICYLLLPPIWMEEEQRHCSFFSLFFASIFHEKGSLVKYTVWQVFVVVVTGDISHLRSTTSVMPRPSDLEKFYGGPI